MNKKLLDAFNEQVKDEEEAARLYLAMAAWFELENYSGFAAWMRAQANEEWGHAMAFHGQVRERGGKAELKALSAPQAAWKSPRDAFEAALKHEQAVTKKIHALYELAMAEKDYPAQVFLQAWVTEQVEEESQAEKMVEAVKRAGDSSPALMILDRHAGERQQGK